MALLTLDLRNLLDTCKVGSEAAKSLEKAWNETKPADDAAKTRLLRELEGKRDGLRTQLLARAKAKKASAVLEMGTVLRT